MLNVSQNALKELGNSDNSKFNIFRLRTLTDGRELEVIHAYTMVKRNCVQKTNVDIQKMFNFMSQIQNGYKNITYHNKTHAADLCQSINMFLMQG